MYQKLALMVQLWFSLMNLIMFLFNLLLTYVSTTASFVTNVVQKDDTICQRQGKLKVKTVNKIKYAWTILTWKLSFAPFLYIL